MADNTAVNDPRLAFDRVPEIYDRVRPTYPNELFDTLFDAMPDGGVAPKILEVGPGTGQATGALLDRGAIVTAIEYGPHLARFLQQKFPDAALNIVNAAFESADVPANSFDAVFCATAYHWIDPDAQINRPLETLKSDGVLAVLDLIQVDSGTDLGYFDRVQPIYESVGNGHRGWTPTEYTEARPKIADHLRASGRYASVELHHKPWDQTYTSAQYRDLLTTYSGTQMMAEPERSDMVDQLIAVIDNEFDGVLTRPLVATLTIARGDRPRS